MKYTLVFLLLFFIGFNLTAQDESENVPEEGMVMGTVMNAANDKPIDRVHIVNLNQVKGAVSDDDGKFEIPAKVNDTLYFTYLGFKSIKVRVTNDWVKYGNVKVKMTELGIALEEVVVSSVTLTGYLEIDAKNIPIYEDQRYSISGLNSAYEGGRNSPSAVSKTLGAIFNPADLVNNIFGSKPKQMRKLRQMKEDDEIRNLLRNKFDRETLSALLQLRKVEIDEILSRCNYSRSFMKSANDLQILDAISGCYEEYKVLNRRN